MKNTILGFLLLLTTQAVSSQHLPAYQLFDENGRKTNFGRLVDRAAESQVILFGELHNNPISHWLQFELSRELSDRKGKNLVLGAEMFESDNQLILTEYLSGLITERNFRAEAKLWRNYETDYRPLVELARERGIPFVATNIPRRYAAMVNRGGFEALETLSEEAKRYIAPLPIAYDANLPGYKAMLEMTGMPGHTGANLPKAQAIKDATMAHFLFKNLKPEGVFIHFNGAFHSNNFEGIYWYLRRLDPNLRILTISTVEQDEVSDLEENYNGLADFIIAVPKTMTKTH
ncbi:MAG TPA: ChaN family lipoprotein [Bacteroidales bacterium]|nr:ChaN family lipoprotein [Bacteroidales bacterium]